MSCPCFYRGLYLLLLLVFSSHLTDFAFENISLPLITSHTSMVLFSIVFDLTSFHLVPLAHLFLVKFF